MSQDDQTSYWVCNECQYRCGGVELSSKQCPKCKASTFTHDPLLQIFLCSDKSCGYYIDKAERCPQCNLNRYAIFNRGYHEMQRYCLNRDCMLFQKSGDPFGKPRVVIEVKDGKLLSVYSNSELEFILVDRDEFDGSASSSVIIPDDECKIPKDVVGLVESASRRPHVESLDWKLGRQK